MPHWDCAVVYSFSSQRTTIPCACQHVALGDVEIACENIRRVDPIFRSLVQLFRAWVVVEGIWCVILLWRFTYFPVAFGIPLIS